MAPSNLFSCVNCYGFEQTIKASATLLDFSEEAICALCSDMKTVEQASDAIGIFTDIVKKYKERSALDYSVVSESMKRISEITGVHIYSCNMLILLAFCPCLYEKYRERGLSDELFVDTVKDLKYKAKESYLIYGVWGTFVLEWFVRFFKQADRFFFARLQFEPEKLEYDCTVDGIELKKGTKVLNVHIPRTETKLSHDEVLRSYCLAAEFYKDYFEGEPIVFVCSSWLLFSGHDIMLKKDSNILAFAHDYALVHEEFYEDAGEVVWRIFDQNYSGDPDELPKNSSLHRAYAELLKKGGKAGHAYGVFVYEKLLAKQNKITN